MPKPTRRQISALVKRFKKDREGVWRREKQKYRAPSRLADAIDAALGLREGDSIPHHQRRVGRRVLSMARVLLQGARRKLAGAKNFCELIRMVKEVTAEVPGFGKLAVYDVAMRIGIWRDIWPRYVYLHAGTRKGARALGLSGDVLEKKNSEARSATLSPTKSKIFFASIKDY